jgi:hypothetical protein
MQHFTGPKFCLIDSPVFKFYVLVVTKPYSMVLKVDKLTQLYAILIPRYAA